MNDFIINSYFGLNLFFAGYYFANDYKWQKTTSEKIACIIWCVLTIFFGTPYITLSLIYVFIFVVLKKINDTFQIVFWFKFYLTKKWDNVDNHILYTLNEIANKKKGKTIQSKIYKHCVSLVNEKNNYVHNENLFK